MKTKEYGMALVSKVNIDELVNLVHEFQQLEGIYKYINANYDKIVEPILETAKEECAQKLDTISGIIIDIWEEWCGLSELNHNTPWAEKLNATYGAMVDEIYLYHSEIEGSTTRLESALIGGIDTYMDVPLNFFYDLKDFLGKEGMNFDVTMNGVVRVI